jgi:dUTP pyrophosphatase
MYIGRQEDYSVWTETTDCEGFTYKHKVAPMFGEVKYVKLSPTAQAPTQGSAMAAGYDLHADLEGKDMIALHPGEVRKISTGIAIALPMGTFGAVYARSGMATKRGLAPVNKVGVIDADYRGPVIVALKNESNELQIIEHGERIAQLVVTPFVSVTFTEEETIGTTARGDGGFGSTDKTNQ